MPSSRLADRFTPLPPPQPSLNPSHPADDSSSPRYNAESLSVDMNQSIRARLFDKRQKLEEKHVKFEGGKAAEIQGLLDELRREDRKFCHDKISALRKLINQRAEIERQLQQHVEILQEAASETTEVLTTIVKARERDVRVVVGGDRGDDDEHDNGQNGEDEDEE